jgi:hypothetical protein
MITVLWLTLAAATTIPVGQGAGFVALADVNGDRRPDIIVANIEDETVSVLLNDGGRRFHPAPGSPFAAGHQPNDIAVADMNGDGHPDLVIANHQSPYVTILLGDGAGAFRPAHNSPFATGSYPHPHGVAVADFTGDGKLDVVVDSWGNNRIALIEGGGNGELVGTRQMFAVGRRPYERLRTADVNRDGHPDIVTTNLDDGTVTILLGDGRGGFSSAAGSPAAAGPAPWQVAIDDVNGDGNVDLIVVPYERDVREPATVGVTVLLGDGTGRFAPMHGSPLSLDGCHGPNVIAVGDFRGTRRRDIAIACASSATVVAFYAEPGGTFTRVVVPNGKGPTWSGIAAADLDGDGTDDLVMANGPEAVVRIVFGGAYAPRRGALGAASAPAGSRKRSTGIR